MPPRNTSRPTPRRINSSNGEGQILVRQGRGKRTVAFQWTDGAGELHYWVLSPAQSSAYLVEEVGA